MPTTLKDTASVLRGIVFPPGGQSSPDLVHAAFNMSTGFSGVLFDLGVLGVLGVSCYSFLSAFG